MRTRIVVIVLAVGLAGCLTLAAAPAAAEERYALVISGASGGPEFAENYNRWRHALVLSLRDTFRFREENLTVMAEQAGPGVTVATRENVRRALAALRAKATKADSLLIVLIGHGTFDGTDAKFNLVGPDMDASEWKALLDGTPARLTMVNTTSASFPFLEGLAAKGRIVITATDSTAQRYETIFPEALIEALQAPTSDLDKNGRISIWEAFTAASEKVRQWYEQRGQLSTERPVLDDTGDGVGKEAGAPGPDGELAQRTYLEPGIQTDTTGDPALAELVRRRDGLEAEIEELKLKRDGMPAADYQREMERLLLDLARVSREIRTKS